MLPKERKLLKEYREFKYRKTGKRGLTAKEKKRIVEKAKSLTKTKTTGSNSLSAKERKILEEYRAYKYKKTGTRGVSLKEKRMILKRGRRLNEGTGSKSFQNLLENYKSYKQQKKGTGSVSYKEIKFLKEAFRRNPRLKEAGEEFAQQPTAQPGMQDATQGFQDPSMGMPQSDVDFGAVGQSLVDAGNALMGTGGMGMGQDDMINDDLGADPQAGIPPVQGQDPNMLGGQLPESVLRDRINRRARDLKETTLEGAAHDVGNLGVPHLTTGQTPDNSISKSPYETVPSPSQVAKGVGSHGAVPGNTWPTKKTNKSHTKESEEKDDATCEGQECLEESNSEITDRYLEKHFGEKLSFKKLSEMLNKGRLG